jgi:hypothetical protein
MTVRRSAVADARARRLAWAAAIAAATVIGAGLLAAWRASYNPWPPAGVSEGVDP